VLLDDYFSLFGSATSFTLPTSISLRHDLIQNNIVNTTELPDGSLVEQISLAEVQPSGISSDDAWFEYLRQHSQLDPRIGETVLKIPFEPV
jgi:hypothetical protein